MVLEKLNYPARPVHIFLSFFLSFLLSFFVCLFVSFFLSFFVGEAEMGKDLKPMLIPSPLEMQIVKTTVGFLSVNALRPPADWA